MKPQYVINVFWQGRNSGSREPVEGIWEHIGGAAGANALCEQASHLLAD